MFGRLVLAASSAFYRLFTDFLPFRRRVFGKADHQLTLMGTNWGKGAIEKSIINKRLRDPVLDLVVVFVGGDFRDWGGKFDRTGFAFYLAAQRLGQGEEMVGA